MPAFACNPSILTLHKLKLVILVKESLEIALEICKKKKCMLILVSLTTLLNKMHYSNYKMDINSSVMLSSSSPHALNHSQRWHISIKTYYKINFHDIQAFFSNWCGNNDIVTTSPEFLRENKISQCKELRKSIKSIIVTSKTACWTFCDWPFNDFPVRNHK